MITQGKQQSWGPVGGEVFGEHGASSSLPTSSSPRAGGVGVTFTFSCASFCTFLVVSDKRVYL